MSKSFGFSLFNTPLSYPKNLTLLKVQGPPRHFIPVLVLKVFRRAIQSTKERGYTEKTPNLSSLYGRNVKVQFKEKEELPKTLKGLNISR